MKVQDELARLGFESRLRIKDSSIYNDPLDPKKDYTGFIAEAWKDGEMVATANSPYSDTAIANLTLKVRALGYTQLAPDPAQEKEMRSEKEYLKRPSFGQITVSRLQSTGGNLYGSNVENFNPIMLRIHESTRVRSHYEDSYHADVRPLIEIVMSPAQWADFVSSFNVGSGTPCTIRRHPIHGDVRHEHDEPQREKIEREFKEKVVKLGEDGVKLAKRASELLNRPGTLSKGDKLELLNLVQQLTMTTQQNLPFVGQMWGELIEKSINEAGREVEAFAIRTLQQAGMEAIASGTFSLSALDKFNDKEVN